MSRASPQGDELTNIWKRTPSRSRKIAPPVLAPPLTGVKMACSPYPAGGLLRKKHQSWSDQRDFEELVQVVWVTPEWLVAVWSKTVALLVLDGQRRP